MIIEGILTTETEDGSMHVAPIGPHVDPELTQWELRPFQTSQSFALLRARSRGVFHVVDDALLMVQSVLARCNPPHASPPARWTSDAGWILEHAVRAIPLSVAQWDVSTDRAIAFCTAGPSVEIRPFWGWNRARNSLLELAVLASRRHLIDRANLIYELNQHRIIIRKTAGPREFEALRLLEVEFESNGT